MDYWKDHEMRPKYFNVVARQLKDPTQWHHGRIWVLGKILVPRRRKIEVISRYHDSPAAGHWGISRTTSMVKRNYVFKNMRRDMRARKCRHQLAARQNGTSGDTCEGVGIGIGGLYLFAGDDVEEFGCDCGRDF